VTPPAALKAHIAATERVASRHPDLLSLGAIEAYFGELYWQKGAALDEKDVLSKFAVDRSGTSFAYRSVGESFRLIEETMAPVIVACSQTAKRLLATLRAGRMTPNAAARKLQPFIVQVPPKDRKALVEAGDVSFVDGFGEQFAVLRKGELYRPEIGLRWEDAGQFDGMA
jgi:CRISPR-associated endonuclease/helicase Cas3